jgi:hypothetical protein
METEAEVWHKIKVSLERGRLDEIESQYLLPNYDNFLKYSWMN